MHRLAIISCQVYESELVHLIEKAGITRIFMERSEENKLFAQKLGNNKVKFFSDIMFMPRTTNEVTLIIDIRPIGLHDDPDELHYNVNSAIDRYKNVADAFLLMYGLCGKGLSSIIERQDIDLYYPNAHGTIVDDCVASVLGPESYLNELARGGSFFLIPGYGFHFDKMEGHIEAKVGREYDPAMTTAMLEYNEYKRAIVIVEGIETKEIYEAEHLLANRFDLPVEYITGTLDILQDAFDSAIVAVS